LRPAHQHRAADRRHQRGGDRAGRPRTRLRGAAGDRGAARRHLRSHRAPGTLLAETGAGVRLTHDVTARAGAHESIAALVGSHTAQVTAPILYGRQTVGRVIMLGKLGDTGAVLFSSLLLSLGAGLTAALAGLAVARRMQRRIAGPVVALTE